MADLTNAVANLLEVTRTTLVEIQKSVINSPRLIHVC